MAANRVRPSGSRGARCAARPLHERQHSFETPTTSELANQQSGAGGFNRPSIRSEPLLRAWPQRARARRTRGGTYQLTAYTANVEDALIPFEVVDVARSPVFRNAGSTRHRGVELGTSLVLPSKRRVAWRVQRTRSALRLLCGHDGNDDDCLRRQVAARRRPQSRRRHLSWQPSRVFLDWETKAQSRMPVNDANSEYAADYVIHGLRGGVGDVAFGPSGLPRTSACSISSTDAT